MITKKSQKVAKKYYCETCDYSCSRKNDYEKHLSTRKHKMVTNDDNDAKKNTNYYICECGNSYKHRQGLSRHKKMCTVINEEKETNNDIGNGGINEKLVSQLVDNFKYVMEEQKEMRSLIKEIIPKIGNTTNTNCHNTTNNTTNKFNMQIFLNETCKDAMPLVDFINNLKLSVEDLDNTGKEGLVNGITNIITKGLNELDVTKRPIHCSDIKRETLYIKDDDKWVKDDKDKTIVTDAIGLVKREADNFFPQWLEEHPNCWEQNNPYHEQYMVMVRNRFGGSDEDIFIERNTKKVIKNIAKEVIVDKGNDNDNEF